MWHLRCPFRVAKKIMKHVHVGFRWEVGAQVWIWGSERPYQLDWQSAEVSFSMSESTAWRCDKALGATWTGKLYLPCRCNREQLVRDADNALNTEDKSHTWRPRVISGLDSNTRMWPLRTEVQHIIGHYCLARGEPVNRKRCWPGISKQVIKGSGHS